MRPSVVIEGPDGAGKTYQAKVLLEQYDVYQYKHEGVPPSKGDVDLLSYYQLLWEDAAKPVVYDRFIAGELVYGPVMRGASRITEEQAVGFVRKNFQDAVHVLVLPPISYCLLAWNKRNFAGKEYVQEYDLFRKIWEGYLRAPRALWDLIVLKPQHPWAKELMEGDLVDHLQKGRTLWINQDGSRQLTPGD